MGRKKIRSPAQAARAELMKAHGLRGGAKANLWLTQDPRTKRDLVLIGDARHEHFYACEGDSEVVDVTYNPEEIEILVSGEKHTVRFDARVQFADGRIEFRAVLGSKLNASDAGAEVPHSAAAEAAARRLGGTYRVVSLRDLDELKQRVSNWRRVLRTLRASSNLQLAAHEAVVRSYMEQRRECVIGDVLDHFGVDDQAKTLATLARLIHQRILHSDLDVAIWSRRTRVVIVRRK